MINSLPPVQVPHKNIEVVEHKINPADYDVIPAKTYEEAKKIASKGGMITKGIDGGYVVVYVPVKK